MRLYERCFADIDEVFKAESGDRYKGEERLKAAFAKQALAAFYDAMDYVFIEDFSTGSKTAENVISGIAGLLFGKEEK